MKEIRLIELLNATNLGKNGNIKDVEAYPIEIKKEDVTPLSEGERHHSEVMLLRCKSCGQNFDSTFTPEEFASLAKDQNESGTLHLCPHCGNLSIYLLKEYRDMP